MFTNFYILKRQFPSICWYFRYTLSQKHIFSGFKLHLHTYIQSMQFPFITYDMALYYTDKTLTLRKYIYASELRQFSYFYIVKLLFLSIFCRYFRYFVSTNDMLAGLHVPTNFQLYRHNSEKTLLGGAPPPPPSLWLR